MSVAPALDHRLLAEAVLLAGSQRHHAAVGDQGRVERVGQVGVVLVAQLVDGGAEGLEECGQGVVLALRGGQVDRVQIAVRGVVEGGAERRRGAFDQHLAQRGGHALGAEGAGAHGCEQ